MNNLLSIDENLKNASVIAEAFCSAVKLNKGLTSAFQKAASLEKKAALQDVQKDLDFFLSLAWHSDSISDFRKDRIGIADNLIRKAETLADVLVNADPSINEDLVRFFKDYKENPNYSYFVDIISVYEEKGAPTLARIAKQALVP